MFTGIIESVSPLLAVRPTGGKTHLTIARPGGSIKASMVAAPFTGARGSHQNVPIKGTAIFDDIRLSSSIAVNGICLTVISLDAASFTVEIMNETMQKTTASAWKNGEMVNLERALSLGDRLDGHWVQGHVDKTTTLLETRTIRQTLYLTFALPAEDKALLVPQGSISINGVSLTLSELKANRFSVALIGHTLENTNLAKLHLGQAVNLEYDILGKYLLRQQSNTLNNQGLFYD